MFNTKAHTMNVKASFQYTRKDVTRWLVWTNYFTWFIISSQNYHVPTGKLHWSHRCNQRKQRCGGIGIEMEISPSSNLMNLGEQAAQCKAQKATTTCLNQPVFPFLSTFSIYSATKRGTQVHVFDVLLLYGSEKPQGGFFNYVSLFHFTYSVAFTVNT